MMQPSFAASGGGTCRSYPARGFRCGLICVYNSRMVTRCLFFLMVAATLGGCAALGRSPRHDAVSAAVESDPYLLYLGARRSLLDGDADRALLFYGRLVEIHPGAVSLWIEYGETAARDGRLQTALQAYQNAAALDDTALEPHLKLAQLLSFVGRWPEAVREYERVRSLQPEYPHIDLLISSLYLEARRPEKAEPILSKLLEQEPSSPVVLYYWGRLQMLRGDYADAEVTLGRALELSPESIDVRMELVSLYEIEKRYASALYLLRDVVLIDPDRPLVRNRLWKMMWASKKWPAAEEVLTNLEDRFPADAFFSLALGWVRYEQDRREEALASFQRAVSVQADYDDALYATGVVLESMKREEEAGRYLLRVSHDSDLFGDAAVRLAFMEARGKRWAAARDRLEAMITEFPKEARFSEALGLIFQEEGKFEKAAVYLKRALELEPENEGVLYELGVVLELGGNREKSLQTMKRLLEKNPYHANALNWVGYSYAEMGQNLDEAERLIRAAIKEKPGDGYFIDSLGWVLFQKGDFRAAVELLQQAIDLAPNDPVIHEHTGDAHWNLGEIHEAVDFYNRALGLSPGEDQLQRLKRKVERAQDR